MELQEKLHASSSPNICIVISYKSLGFPQCLLDQVSPNFNAVTKDQMLLSDPCYLSSEFAWS